MAVVSHPALSPEWSFPSPLNPFDASSFGPHIELADHPVTLGSVQQLHKRRAHEVEWSTEDVLDRADPKAKKIKTSPSHTVEPQQLHANNSSPHELPNPHLASGTRPQQIQQVISILVDAFASSNSTPMSSSIKSTATLNTQTEPEITVSIKSNIKSSTPSILRPVPTSPLSDCPDRAPFVRKVIGGACAGKTEPSLARWVLCRNHFLRVRSLDPTAQSSEWVQTLHDIGWEQLHPVYQAQSPMDDADAFAALGSFSRWIEDEFDYDAADEGDGELSDEEEEDGELHEDFRDNPAYGQRSVWDSGIVLQIPCKPIQ